MLLLALAFPAFAQKLPVIGYLGAESSELFAQSLAAFRRGLAETSYVEGRNVTIEYRWAGGDNARLAELAADLVARKVNVLVAPGSAEAAFAAKKATTTIPIVFEVGIDPVASGLVHTMNRPGGNATGVTSLNTGLGPRRLQLLRELVPGMTSFALLVNPTNPRNAEAMIDDLQVAAHAQRLQFQIVRAATESDLAVVFENLARQHVGGLVLANDTFFVNRSKEIAALALRHRIPAIHQPPDFVAAGGLVSYAGSFDESHRLAGVYTGRVLRGDKPADLPVQQVSKMELHVNAATAKALGLTVPHSILARAAGVIE
ncbi:MAG TPA: ABC transporter substrate-binding protein [Burkholderiales bacterium]|nr:ABC transporter substrate-binding protein [Burkholderiales bacterium]